MEIHRDTKNGKPWLSQEKYVEKILQTFGMDKVKVVNIPLSSHYKIYLGLCLSNVEENKYVSRVPYTNVVGSMIYLMVCARPYILDAVGVSRDTWKSKKRALGRTKMGV